MGSPQMRTTSTHKPTSTTKHLSGHGQNSRNTDTSDCLIFLPKQTFQITFSNCRSIFEPLFCYMWSCIEYT